MLSDTYILAVLEMKLFRNSFPKFLIKEARKSLQSVLSGSYLTHKLKEKIGIPIQTMIALMTKDIQITLSLEIAQRQLLLYLKIYFMILL
jgi:hypothetical protein